MALVYVNVNDFFFFSHFPAPPNALDSEQCLLRLSDEMNFFIPSICDRISTKSIDESTEYNKILKD